MNTAQTAAALALFVVVVVLFGNDEPYNDDIFCTDCRAERMHQASVVFRMWRNTSTFPVPAASWQAIGFEVADYDHETAAQVVKDAGYGDVWRQLPNYAGKADLFRLVVIRSHGGWYADADMEPKPLLSTLNGIGGRPILFNGACGWMCINRAKYWLGIDTVTHAPQYRNEIFAAPKMWPPLTTALDLMRRQVKDNHLRKWTIAEQIDFTGPGLFTDAVSMHPNCLAESTLLKCSRQPAYFGHLRLHTWH